MIKVIKQLIPFAVLGPRTPAAARMGAYCASARKMAQTVEGMTEPVYVPDKERWKNAHIPSMEKYREMYKQSIEDPKSFWSEIAKQFYWKEEPKGEVCRFNLDVNQGPISIKWFEGAQTNMSYNVLDRIIEKGLGDNIAYYWEGNDPDDSSKITYKELHREVCKFANVLKSKGVKKGDCVAIYMPMIVELVIAMLACSRIGAMHSIVFGGFSCDSLAERLIDAECKILVTADGVWRGAKLVNLKEIVDEAATICNNKNHSLSSVIVVRHLGTASSSNNCNDHNGQPTKRPSYDLKTSWTDIDSWWHEHMADASDKCDPVWVDAEDPLFILYTSGSTGKPKGIMHTTGGYLLYAATTFLYDFDYHPEDVYFCTADIGWITGHSYVVYGPLAQGATSVMFEGVPFHPDAGRYWAIVEKYKVNSFYTAPTAIRSLMKAGDSFVQKYDRSSLKILGTVGEPINPEAWLWYYRVVGNNNCSIVDTYWQTETGGHVLTPLPGCTPSKPGSATLPFFGVDAKILNEAGEEIEGKGEGYLCFKSAWPGIMRTVYKNQERYESTYFQRFPGYYFTGDGAMRDKDGYFWVTGRVDDMLNVSGHLLSTAEVESALIEHQSVAETAVVSAPHEVKGECLYCFIVLKDGHEFTKKLCEELKQIVRHKIGPFATPEHLHYAQGLPKTRSGKIMRRVLRKIVRGDRDFGDLSTLADQSIVEELFATRPNGL